MRERIGERVTDLLDFLIFVVSVSLSFKSECFLNEQCEDIEHRKTILTVSVRFDLMTNTFSDIRERVRT